MTDIATRNTVRLYMIFDEDFIFSLFLSYAFAWKFWPSRVAVRSETNGAVEVA